jgi:hypothetical protein
LVSEDSETVKPKGSKIITSQYCKLNTHKMLIYKPSWHSVKYKSYRIYHGKHVPYFIILNAELASHAVAARFKAWTVFARSNAGIVGSNPTQGMDGVRLFRVCIVLCR